MLKGGVILQNALQVSSLVAITDYSLKKTATRQQLYVFLFNNPQLDAVHTLFLGAIPCSHSKSHSSLVQHQRIHSHSPGYCLFSPTQPAHGHLNREELGHQHIFLLIIKNLPDKNLSYLTVLLLCIFCLRFFLCNLQPR